jgi:putative tryptophan/tyrosine transport system substrate-binding protein
MRRRQFIKFVGAAAATWPLAARAQQSKPIPRIGVLWHAGNEHEQAIYLGALRQGFSEIGYIEGKHFVLENRYAAEQYEHYDPLAAQQERRHRCSGDLRGGDAAIDALCSDKI